MFKTTIAIPVLKKGVRITDGYRDELIDHYEVVVIEDRKTLRNAYDMCIKAQLGSYGSIVYICLNFMGIK